MIRVLLVDDSPIVLHILQRVLARVPEIQVVGTAPDGREALELVSSLKPDVVCLDYHMPVMNGLEFTRALMASHPLPILVVSVSVESGSPDIFRLLEAGAVDYYPKPRDIVSADQNKLAKELGSKIRIVSGVRVIRRQNHAPAPRPVAKPVVIPHPQAPLRMVVIGASTGGPQALRDILGSLPANFPLPVVCVQHIGSSFLTEMVAWLAESSPMPVLKATHGTIPQPGVIYFVPEDTQMELGGNACFALTSAPPYGGHRPSVTVTMRAAARCFGAGTIGVLLTGMGRDGADGMKDIAAAGGITIAQDEASSVVYGMPREAVALGAVQHILPLEQIAPMLVALANNHAGANEMAGK